MSKRRQQEEVRPLWTPFRPIEFPPPNGVSTEEWGECFINSRFMVFRRVLQSGLGPVIHLSIKNRDNSAHHDWREFQRVKNELIGEEEDAIEIYPAESRCVDTSNQYHIWCVLGMPIPMGFAERHVSEKSSVEGLNQRPWPPGEKPKGLVHLSGADTPTCPVRLPRAPNGEER
jgi:hypothetical protein